jgi:hypothetical protein
MAAYRTRTNKPIPALGKNNHGNIVKIEKSIRESLIDMSEESETGGRTGPDISLRERDNVLKTKGIPEKPNSVTQVSPT